MPYNEVKLWSEHDHGDDHECHDHAERTRCFETASTVGLKRNRECGADELFNSGGLLNLANEGTKASTMIMIHG